MKLREFYDVMGPYLAGQRTLEETARALGDDINVARLGIYGRFCQLHREGILDTLFPLTRAAAGNALWEELGRAFFQAHPTRDWELNANAERFPEFLASRRERDPRITAWLPDLADLEWWEWASYVAQEADPEPARKHQVNPTLALRQYAHDVVTYADDDERTGAPAAQPTFAAFWRDARLQPCRRRLGGAELGVIKAVMEDVALKHAAAAMGVEEKLLRSAREGLCRAGIILRPTRK
ncbi:MAG: putative DNA-binding domain-containing protein [Myxococcota bacterium]